MSQAAESGKSTAGGGGTGKKAEVLNDTPIVSGYTKSRTRSTEDTAKTDKLLEELLGRVAAIEKQLVAQSERLENVEKLCIPVAEPPQEPVPFALDVKGLEYNLRKVLYGGVLLKHILDILMSVLEVVVNSFYEADKKEKAYYAKSEGSGDRDLLKLLQVASNVLHEQLRK